MKMRSQAGFSLAETLLALLLLLLVTLLLANGVPLAKDAYDRVVVAANARVMLTNAVSVLRDELATARNVCIGATDNSITYISANTGATSRIDVEAVGGAVPKITLQEYIDYEPGTVAPTSALHSTTARDLVPAGSDNRLYVSYTGKPVLSDKGDYITINNLAVYKTTDTTRNKPMASIEQLIIRIIIPSANP